MITRHGILVAVDGSAESDAAVGWAAREAEMRQLPLTVMHVIVPVVVTWPVRYLEADYRRSQEHHAQIVIDLATQIAKETVGESNIQMRAEVRHGSTVPELIAESKKATITVAGSRGLGAVGGGLLGSVSRGLLHHGVSPMAIIHSSESRPDSSAPVLLGVDDSSASDGASAMAFEEASLRGVELVALHAWSDVSAPPPCDIDWQTYQQEGTEILDSRLSDWKARYPNVRVRPLLVCDRPAHWLLDEAQRAQLLVVGRRGRGGFARLLLGSVSTTVAESSPTPVIVVPSTQRN